MDNNSLYTQRPIGTIIFVRCTQPLPLHTTFTTTLQAQQLGTIAERHDNDSQQNHTDIYKTNPNTTTALTKFPHHCVARGGVLLIAHNHTHLSNYAAASHDVQGSMGVQQPAWPCFYPTPLHSSTAQMPCETRYAQGEVVLHESVSQPTWTTLSCCLLRGCGSTRTTGVCVCVDIVITCNAACGILYSPANTWFASLQVPWWCVRPATTM